MINLIPYRESCIEFYKAIVEKKHDKNLVKRLKNIEKEIDILFKEYSDLSNQNDLKSISPFGYRNRQKKDLLSLYRYQLNALIKLKTDLTTIKGRKHNTCQMCTIEPVKSFDHILPKEEFPEFSVNPINLLPSCSTCNGHKGSQWILNNERIFLNIYFDQLPNLRYLVIDFKNYPIPIFSIDGTQLAPAFYKLIQSHYEKLHLFDRFRESSNDVIDPLITMGKSLVPKYGIDDFRQTIKDSTNEMMSIYGSNHWKSLLQLAIVNHNDFESLLL